MPEIKGEVPKPNETWGAPQRGANMGQNPKGTTGAGVKTNEKNGTTKLQKKKNFRRGNIGNKRFSGESETAQPDPTQAKTIVVGRPH